MATTTFTPQAQRNTGLPDIEYGYDGLDWIFTSVEAAANLTFVPGISKQ